MEGDTNRMISNIMGDLDGKKAAQELECSARGKYSSLLHAQLAFVLCLLQ